MHTQSKKKQQHETRKHIEAKNGDQRKLTSKRRINNLTPPLPPSICRQTFDYPFQDSEDKKYIN